MAICLSAKILHETSEDDVEWKSIKIRTRRSATGKSSKDGESPRVVYLKNLGAGDISPAHFKRSPFSIDTDLGCLSPLPEEPRVVSSPSPFSSPNSLKYFFSPEESGDDIEAEFWKVSNESIPSHDNSHPTPHDDSAYKDV